MVLRGRLTPDEGAVLVAALEQAERSLRAELADAPDAAAERMSAEQIRADALGEVARGSLRAAAEGASIVPSVAVHVDVASLLKGTGDRCEIVDGPSIASETARRLTCDCSLQSFFEANGDVVDMGRMRRTVSPRMRKALEERDRTCVFPGCDRRKFCEAHHIVHWLYEGKTKLMNLALLCWHHHRFMHEGGYSMRMEPDMTFTFFRPDGSVIPRTSRLGGGDAQALIATHIQEKLAIDSRTCTTMFDGGPVSLEDCVYSLLSEGGMLAIPRRGPEVSSN